MRATTLLTTTVLATTVLLLGACGDDGPTAAPTSSLSGTGTTSPTDTAVPDTVATTEPPSDEEAVLAAVQCYWDTIVEANDPPNPDHPGFDRCFTGPALERWRGSTTDRLALGQAVTDPTPYEGGTAAIRQLRPDSALVAACFVDDAVLIDRQTGQHLNNVVATLEMDIDLVLGVDARWRVTDVLITSRTDGAAPCNA